MVASVPIISRLRFDPSIERRSERIEGSTLAEIIADELPGVSDAQLNRLVVTLTDAHGEATIERRLWRFVRPKAAATVTLRLQVGGGSALRSVLSLAIMAATAVFAAWALPVLGPLVTGLASAAIGAGSNLLLGALGKTDEDKVEQRYTISGTRNQANPWGPVPVLLGRHRIYPPVAAQPYSEIIGDDQYWRFLFLIGEGGHSLDDFRIGETEIGSFGGVELEARGGWPGDAPITLYEETVIEDQLGIEIVFEDGFTIRRSARAADALSIDLYFPQGLYWTDADREIRSMSCALEVQYRVKGENGAPDGWWISAASLFIEESKNDPFWRTLRWEVSSPGTYEVQIKRIVAESEDSDTQDTVQWACLRTIRYAPPIVYPRPLALVALKIRASRQLSGTLDQFNLIAHRAIPDYDAASGNWVTRVTSNPASAFRQVLQGPATALPRGDDELDLDALADWHEWCAGKGLVYNRYHDFDATARDVLAQVAAAGRASPTQAGGRWSVVIDRPQTIVRAHITPRNASGFSGEKTYSTLPDAYRIKYLDETDGWKQAERIVNRPDLVGPPTLYEEIELPGYTHPDLILRGARWRFAQLMLRSETWYATQDFEYLTAPRGGLMLMQYPVLNTAMASARVKSVTSITIGGAERTLVILDELVTMAAGNGYVVRFRLRNGSSALWTIDTIAGETDRLLLGAGPALPAPGDLAMFGLAGSETIECIVAGIEAQKDLAARLTLIPHAPEIESLADG